MIRVVHPGSGFFTHLDPGVKKATDPRFRIRIRNTAPLLQGHKKYILQNRINWLEKEQLNIVYTNTAKSFPDSDI